MKKNISINLQGMIFHIEEDGYDQLSQYLAAIKNYFSSYEGHEEITADIEARIAEIFFAKLSPVKQVITRDDVQALIAQMGSVKDFQSIEEEEETTYTSSAYQKQTSTNSGNPTNPDGTSKRIYRDENRKVLGGVAAGIANYLNIDPLWVRLGIIVLFFLFAIPGGFPAGLIVIAYLMCWIAFPKSYILPESPTKKLFRNPFDKKLGGVASGIALFFGMDIAVIRLLFLISVFLGGFGVIAYFVLWIIVPEANTITDRVQMEGNPITLSSIEETVKNNLKMKDENGQESALASVILFPVRLIAQVLQFFARVLGPFLNFLVGALRILAGVLLMVVAISFIFALFLMGFTALNIVDGSEIIDFGDLPFSMFVNSFPGYGLLAGFLAILLPALFIMVLAIGLLLKRFYLRPAVGWSLFGIWILSLFVIGLAIFDFRNDFRESGEFESQRNFPVSGYETVLLNARDTESFRNQRAYFEISTYPGQDIRLVQEFSAKGTTEKEAIQNAQMITYRSNQQDSTITFDESFKFAPNAVFREQRLNLRLLIPENKKIRISSRFRWLISENYFEGNYDNDNMDEQVWMAKNNKLVCLNCPPPDTTSQSDSEENFSEDNSEDENFENDVPDSPLYDDEQSYGDDSRSFPNANFREIDIQGAYHVKIRQGNTFSIKAYGKSGELSDVRISQNGNELTIKPDRRVIGFNLGDQDATLITIEMPELNKVDISGASKADISGFNTNDFTLSESGAADVLLQVNARKLDVEVSGASELTLIGNGTDIKVEANGASKIIANQFKADNVEADVTGASEAFVFALKRLKANVSGPSHIKYRGNPETINRNLSHIGSIEQE